MSVSGRSFKLMKRGLERADIMPQKGVVVRGKGYERWQVGGNIVKVVGEKSGNVVFL